MSDYVFTFDSGDGKGADVLGGKGAGLVRLVKLGLRVPPGFVVSCRAGIEYLDGEQIPAGALAEIREHLAALEEAGGRRLGDDARPLLVSVRSGAPVSMPGMMDTVLNVGLTEKTVVALARETRDPAFAWDCYARFAESYARIVRGIGAAEIEERMLDIELSGAGGEDRSRAIVGAMQELMVRVSGTPVPDEPAHQILETIEAVFRSWNSSRAHAYRRFRGIDAALGTAAVVQTMVFGNRGDSSGSGVAFTRDPSTGRPGAFGDFLFDAQGEDVVDGSRDALPLSELKRRLPETFAELQSSLRLIEAETGDLCEIEFTVEDACFWLLQTRVGQRSGQAAVRIAVELVDEGLIDAEEAVARVTPAQAEAASAPAFTRPATEDGILMRGLGASPGAAVGTVVFSVAEAVEAGEAVILVRPTTSPSDVAGFIAAAGIVTGRGGGMSHAAVVARGMNRPAVCGVGEVIVAEDGRSATINGRPLAAGTLISLDGTAGVVAQGAIPRGASPDQPLLTRLLGWCEERVEVPLVKQPVNQLPAVEAVGDSPTLVLNDPSAMPVDAANAAIADINRGGGAPFVVVGSSWARAADRGLTGVCRGVGCLDEVVSLPLVARDVKVAVEAPSEL